MRRWLLILLLLLACGPPPVKAPDVLPELGACRMRLHITGMT